MQIINTGIDSVSGEPLVQTLDEGRFGDAVFASIEKYFNQVTDQSARQQIASSFKGEVERRRTTDLGDPRQAGWTYLINPGQPGVQAYVNAIRRLAQHRGMQPVDEPLVYNNEGEADWRKWIERYTAPQSGKTPYYILIVGGPDQVPFGFQSLLNSAAAVGRVDFDHPDDLAGYAEKLIRLEQGDQPVVGRQTIFLAPDHGEKDATHYSQRYMAQPLAEHVLQNYGMETTCLFAGAATKGNFLATAGRLRPALVYTASHGFVAPNKPLEHQKQVYGAIFCQEETAGEALKLRQVAAVDIPTDRPFLEGAVFFQFACYGYGNPAKSDFELWLGFPQKNANQDFVSALPRRLLGHSHGPIAYIGHIDSAWMHGFIEDPDHPLVGNRWNQRLQPFRSAISSLLEVQPVGLAMGKMYQRYLLENSAILNSYSEVMRGDRQVTPEYKIWLADLFISRSDAQNYMIYGDPAAALRIPGSP